MSGQLTGASRMTTGFQVSQLENQEIQNMLTLYKQPATIRDMKQVYFYTEVRAILTNIEPTRLFYEQWRDGADLNEPFLNAAIHAQSRNYYFGNIGTSKEFDISEKVNSLLDVRVPKDKYVFEINLAECTIETDTSGWTANPDYGIVYASNIKQDNNPNGAKSGQYIDIYSFTDEAGIADGSDPPVKKLAQSINQSTKLSSPQTLYCRIKELSNGEPYNWSVTNSGDYSIDKSHQLLVRHGDINYSKLTLEYGHMAFTGDDSEYFDKLKASQNNINTQVGDFAKSNNGRYGSNLDNNERFNRPVYIDYNREVFNCTNTPEDQLDVYPSYYKGLGGLPVFGKLSNQNKLQPQPITGVISGGGNIVTPVNRPPYFFIGKNSGFPDTQPIVLNANDGLGLQGRPLFYSQQAHKIGFRFMIRLIALF